MQDTEQHISILWNFLDLRQSLTRISSPFYQVSMFLYAPRLNKLFIYLPPTLWRWVCMSSLLYLLSKNAKALHYFILPTLGRLSNQQLESQGVDLTEIGQQTKTQYPSKGYSKPVRKISQGPLYRSWGLKKKNKKIFFEPFATKELMHSHTTVLFRTWKYNWFGSFGFQKFKHRGHRQREENSWGQFDQRHRKSSLQRNAPCGTPWRGRGV